MSEIVLKVENLYKQYRLGTVNSQTLTQDLNRWWARVRGREDPYSKIGSTNHLSTNDGEYVWALQDINFEVKQGEVLGIIGKNGAGKSTLLKILSQVTAPTKGNVKVKGRIASLLEVGTGFHPELTGRENIFLNGAILGMTKSEIKRKFDKIVDFAGVAKYIDTPVKRYSSGMYVRLAFGVAAHLEPEILIVDEVLAVGDAEFQKKALGKMQDVSKNEGRTVLFVSHNMGVMADLCTKGLLLMQGQTICKGEITETIKKYLEGLNAKSKSEQYTATIEKELYIKNAYTIDTKGYFTKIFAFSEDILIELNIHSNVLEDNVMCGIAVLDNWGKKIFTTTHFIGSVNDGFKNSIRVIIPSKFLLPGQYSLDIAVYVTHKYVYEYLNDICSFDIIDDGSEFAVYGNNFIGNVNINCQWIIK